jgi:hypothetical protein
MTTPSLTHHPIICVLYVVYYRYVTTTLCYGVILRQTQSPSPERGNDKLLRIVSVLVVYHVAHRQWHENRLSYSTCRIR